MVCRAELRVGDQLGSVTDHVLWQFVDLVGNFTNTIDTLFLGFPEVVRELFDNLKFKNYRLGTSMYYYYYKACNCMVK